MEVSTYSEMVLFALISLDFRIFKIELSWKTSLKVAEIAEIAETRGYNAESTISE